MGSAQFATLRLAQKNQMTDARSSSKPSFTAKQGQYLAFIYAYTCIMRRPPAEADMQRHFQVTPPTVHRRILALERTSLNPYASL